VIYKIRETVLVLTDLSELASVETYVDEAQRERDSARDELRRANDQKDHFLAVLSHELRNPLASIRAATHLLQSERATTHERQRALEIIDRQTRYQTRLIDDLLDMNRISQGRIELKREAIDLRRVIQNVVGTYLSAIEAKSLSFRFDNPGSPVVVFADQVRIEQIVANLLTNSLKFTRAGGSIEITLNRSGPLASISVRDTGAGIEPSKLNQVFDLYSQAQSGHGTDGLGIGLWLARQLAELHGGTITVKSEGLDRGTQVTVELTCIEELTAEGSSKILLVEDDPDQRELLAAVLHESTIEIIGTRDGDEALAAAVAAKFDVCILDLNLPDISGYDLVHKLIEVQKPHRPLMIALTGYGRPEDVARVKAAGFDYHLVKPVDIDEIQRVIAESKTS
jgi:CheY-like chemotaxis protein/two-component sensor histidine kinase